MIREAVINDFEQLQSIVQEVHNLHCEARPDVYNDVTEPLSKDYFNGLIINNETKVFVIDIENEIVAYSILKVSKTQNIPILRPSAYVYIDDLAVKASYRNNGLGKKLFAYIKEFAKDINADSIQLNVWEFNKPAIDFYESIGMKTRNRRMEIRINR